MSLVLAQPYWLLAVFPLIGIWWLAAYRRGVEQEPGVARLTLVHPDLSHLSSAEQSAAPGQRGQLHLYGVAMLLLILALAQPQSMGELIPEKPEGRDIVLLIDTSRTMNINDFELEGQRVERLAVLKGVVSRFVAQREGDRFGVIVFGSTAATLAPPSFDRDLVNGMIQRVQVGMAGDNTALGDAIGLALKQVRERQALRPALLLFSDNTDSNAGELQPGEAVELATHMGAAIYTVQIGSDLFAEGRKPAKSKLPFANLLPLPNPPQKGEGTNASLRELEFDEPDMQQIAALTGGKYYRADSSGSLQAVVEDIGKLEQTITRPATRRRVVEWYGELLLLAASILTLARIMQIRKVAA